MKKIELLAPAGSFEKAKIAFLYGADAVYCGTASVSLRSRAAIDDDDLIRTIKYAHSINKKVYVAMNIYAFDTDYEEIRQMCKKLEEVKPDGIIAADPGVISTILEYAPSVPVNISTQSNLVSLESCKFWYNQGCKRMIMAREMDKNQLKYIMENKPEGMEIEIFVHGAICFSYSGRCFLSDFLCGRSANYGSCAQSCRWSYNVYLEEKNNPGNLMPVEMDEHGTSILSSKDLCLIKELPEIIDMGVDSLKIEGRLKTEYYIASIVSIYRSAIDDYQKNPKKYDAQKYIKEIEKIKTRGLTTFYFNNRENKDIQEYEGKQYNADYEFGGKVIQSSTEKTVIEIRNKLSIGDELEILVPGKLEPIKFKIEKLWDIETDEMIETINPGKLGQQVKIKLPIKCEENWIIRRKKKNSIYEKNNIQYNQKLIPILNDLENKEIKLAGGSVVSMVLSIINSLINYICNLTIEKKGYENVQNEVKIIKNEAEILKGKMLKAIDEDRKVLENVLNAYKIKKENPEELEKASKASAEFCYNVMRNAIDTIKLIEKIKKVGNNMLSCDFEISMEYAIASVKASIINIETNLEPIHDEKFVQKIRQNYKKMSKTLI